MSVQLSGFGSSLKYRLHEIFSKVGLHLDNGHGDLNRRLQGYPSNHNFRISRGRILPSRQLVRRMRKVVGLYAADMDSLLDVACCRGAYVLEAARRPGCKRAVGIDVHEPFVALAEAGRQAIGAERASFRNLGHAELAERIDEFGGPFHTVLLLGAYHYLFWGSEAHPTGALNHRDVLSVLSRICTHRLIVSMRMDVAHCPTFIRERAKTFQPPLEYDQASFARCAEEFFHVRQAGQMGASPLLLLTK